MAHDHVGSDLRPILGLARGRGTGSQGDPMKRAMCLLALVLLQGCATAPRPDRCFANLDHVSHPTRGRPFFGPATEEDAFTSIGATCRWERGRVFIESGLSYMPVYEGFYGGELLYNGRVAYMLWEKR